MNSLNIIIALIFIAIFVASIVVVEAVNESSTVHWWQRTISYYLDEKIKWHTVQVVGLMYLVAAEILIAGQYLDLGILWLFGMCTSIAGISVVAITGIKLAQDGAVNRDTHILFAAMAFMGVLFSEGVALWGSPWIWIVWGALISTFTYVRFAATQRALEEKTLVLFMIVGMVAVVAHLR